MQDSLLGDLQLSKASVDVIRTQAALISPHPPPFRGALHGWRWGALVSKRGRVLFGSQKTQKFVADGPRIAIQAAVAELVASAV